MTLLVQALEDAPALSAILTGPDLTLVLQNRRSREQWPPDGACEARATV